MTPSRTTLAIGSLAAIAVGFALILPGLGLAVPGLIVFTCVAVAHYRSP